VGVEQTSADWLRSCSKAS